MSGLTLHWRRRAIYGDIARGSCGLVLCAIIMPAFSMLSIGQVAFAGLCILFGSYVFGSVLKLASNVTISDEGIALSRPLLGEKRVRWSDARAFEVRYFSVGQIQKKALIDVKVSDGRTSIVMDDGLEDFAGAVRQCWLSARAHGIGVSDSTMANLAAAGCVAETAQQHG
jgi:hypothetical protein